MQNSPEIQQNKLSPHLTHQEYLRYVQLKTTQNIQSNLNTFDLKSQAQYTAFQKAEPMTRTRDGPMLTAHVRYTGPGHVTP